MTTELVHVGFGQVLAADRIVAIVTPGSSPTRRLIQQGREKGFTIDMTNGRRTKSVIFMDSGHVILSSVTPETLANRAVVRPIRHTISTAIEEGRAVGPGGLGKTEGPQAQAGLDERESEGGEGRAIPLRGSPGPGGLGTNG